MENKAEILQKLYNIRAGLSAVSVQKDQVAQLEEKIDETKKQVVSHQKSCNPEFDRRIKEIDTNRAVLSKQKIALISCEMELEFKENAKKPKQHMKQWMRQRNDLNDALSLILFVLGIVLAVGGAILFISGMIVTGFEVMDYHLLFLPCLGIGIPLSVVFGIKTFRYVRFYTKKDYSAYFENLQKRITETKSVIQRLELHINALESDFNDYNTKLKNHRLALSDSVRALQNSIPPIITYANGMYDVVVKEYGDFLSVSDWQNLDYIIYLFETGRADTIKESLILLDEMKRHDMLMKAMGHIASTIRAGFGELNSTMMRGFSMMSSQLESMSSQMDSIRSAQQSNNALLGDLGKKMDVYNALCAKANTTSETMMKDVDYIKSRLSR